MALFVRSERDSTPDDLKLEASDASMTPLNWESRSRLDHHTDYVTRPTMCAVCGLHVFTACVNYCKTTGMDKRSLLMVCLWSN